MPYGKEINLYTLEGNLLPVEQIKKFSRTKTCSLWTLMSVAVRVQSGEALSDME